MFQREREKKKEEKEEEKEEGKKEGEEKKETLKLQSLLFPLQGTAIILITLGRWPQFFANDF